MFLDASAIVAILVREPEFEGLVDKLEAATMRLISPLARYEAVLAVGRLLQVPSLDATGQAVDRFLDLYDVKTVDVTPEIGNEALAAFVQFGKGRHKARLNMGDCFAYACAKQHRVPILCKGNDFRETDIKIA